MFDDFLDAPLTRKAFSLLPAGLRPRTLPFSAHERLLVKPADIWPGDAEKGRALMEGCFTFHGKIYNFPNPFTHNIWQPDELSPAWHRYLNGFTWLRDLRACRMTDAVQAGYTLIDNWIRQHQYLQTETRSSSELNIGDMGQRLSQWIAHYDFFMADAPQETAELFFASLNAQNASLARHFQITQSTDHFKALKGLLYCAVALEGQDHMAEKIKLSLEEALAREFFSDGGHISRSPAELLGIIRILLDIRRAYDASHSEPPVALQDAIDNLTQALRFFRHGDKKMALFYGAQEDDPGTLDDIITQASLSGRTYHSLPKTGFERLSVGRGLAIFDSGVQQKKGKAEPPSYAALSFEFSFGKDRIFVNCGSHPIDENWRDALASPAAYNVLSLPCDLKQSASSLFKARHNQVPQSLRQDGKGYHQVESSSGIYLQSDGVIYTRRLYLGDKGQDLQGQEDLSVTQNHKKERFFTVRFHIHPQVSVSLIHNNSQALLRLKNGVGWRFSADGGDISLENSVYLGTGTRPRKTKQLVISGHITQERHIVNWALKREGI